MGAGCSPGTQTVYIDVPAVVASTASEAAPDPVIPPPPKAEPGVFARLQGQAATPIADRPSASGERLRNLITQAQEKALRDINNRLRRFYESELKRFELEQQGALSEAQRKAWDDASRELRTIFEGYAHDRSPVFVQLTLLAGFPESNPTSQPPENPLPKPLQKRFDQSVDLRARLHEIDAGFDAQVAKLFDSVQDLTAEQITSMRGRVEDYKAELDRKAEEEAKAQVRMTATEFGLHLIEPIVITLPATKSEQVGIPAQPALPAPPPVPRKGILESAQDRERLVRHELDIWAKLNRYQVVEKPGSAADKTGAFQTWRRQFAVGP